MRNLKNILDVCDIYISGEFVEFRNLDFYPASGLHVLVIKKINFDCAEKYSILIPAADWEYVRGLGLSAGDEICAPVYVNFSFDINHPMIWLSDRYQIVKK
ncbi:hypothetical protein F157LOC_01030 [Pectobacterium brasiliense]|nr:hypothetical protein F157LOC_01030 [Pectobacterium brasiliense]